MIRFQQVRLKRRADKKSATIRPSPIVRHVLVRKVQKKPLLSTLPQRGFVWNPVFSRAISRTIIPAFKFGSCFVPSRSSDPDVQWAPPNSNRMFSNDVLQDAGLTPRASRSAATRSFVKPAFAIALPSARFRDARYPETLVRKSFKTCPDNCSNSPESPGDGRPP